MKTIPTYLLIAVVTLFSPVALSQGFWDNVSIRKAFESQTDDDDKAATISVTFPEEGDDIFKVNAGIGYTFALLEGKTNHDLTTFYVYNKNNQIDKEQENYKFGLNYSMLHQIRANQALLNDTSLEYMNDNTKKTRSFLALTYLYFLSNRDGFPKLGSYALKPNCFAYQLNPKIGLEYQNDFDREAPLETGYTLRSYFNIGGNLLIKKKTVMTVQTVTQQVDTTGKAVGAPQLKESTTAVANKMFWKKGLELVVNYEGRNILSDDYDENPNYLYMFKGELRLYPIMNDNFSVGLSYNKGENPLSGLEKQEFWMLSLSFLK